MTQEDTTCNRLDLDGRVLHEVEMMQGQRWLEGVMTGQHEHDSENTPNQHAEST